MRVTGQTFCGGIELGANFTALERTGLAGVASAEVESTSALETVGSVANYTALVLILALDAISIGQIKASLTSGTCGEI